MSDTPSDPDDRFGKLVERGDGSDFPFYRGAPIAIGGSKWLLLWLSTVAAFGLLMVWRFGGIWGVLVAQVLFLAIPLIALIVLVPQHWRALWRRVTAKDLGLVVVFWLLAFVVQLGMGSLLGSIDKTAAADPAARAKEGGAEIASHFLGALPQLMGEELLAIIPFLAILWLGVNRLGWTRRTSIIVALLVSSAWFGAVHLPTYDWNFAQAVVGVGLVRVALTLAYIRTKNLWVSFGAHVMTDYIVFLTLLR